jgi:ankyrin repeat protein
MKIFHVILVAAFSLMSASIFAADIYMAIENKDRQSIIKFAQSNNISAIYDSRGGTPLNFSIKLGRFELTKLLIDLGAALNGMSNDKTPLMYAAKYKELKAAEYLITKGAKLNAVNSRKKTALMYAARYGSKEIAEALIAAGADVRPKDYKNRTAYDTAVEYKRQEVSVLLRNAN